MHYVDNHKHTKISLAIACICAILSPHWFAQTVQHKEIKTAIYQTWSEIQKTNSSSWTIQETKEIRKCDQECKVETLIKIGITSNLANLIVSECKNWALDPRKCIIIASAIVINESGGGKSNACKTRFNCFWIWSGKVSYTSHQEMMVNWVQKYNRWWKNAKDMSFFYAESGEVSPSKYCFSEESSDTDVGCPIGKKITTWIFNKLNKIF